MSSSERRTAILNALARGLYGDNLLDIAAHARELARGNHDVATWTLIYLGFTTLANYWNDPVQAETAASVEKTPLPACEGAIREQTPYAREAFARELIRAFDALSAQS